MADYSTRVVFEERERELGYVSSENSSGPQGREYAETLMDSGGKQLLMLRRFSLVRHKRVGEACMSYGICCPLCWLLERFASCWQEEMVVVVEMPAGKKIATLSYARELLQPDGEDEEPSELQVLFQSDSGHAAYRVLFPQAQATLARGTGPIFQTLRAGTESPVGRIKRMLDENSGVCSLLIQVNVCSTHL